MQILNATNHEVFSLPRHIFRWLLSQSTGQLVRSNTVTILLSAVWKHYELWGLSSSNQGYFRMILLENVDYIPQQQHNLVTVCQLTRCADNTCDSLDIKTRTWRNADGVVFPFTYARNEFIWKALAFSEIREATFDGAIVHKCLAATCQQSVDSNVASRPFGNTKSARRSRVWFQDNLPTDMKPAERKFLGQHGLTAEVIKRQEQESRIND